MIVNRFLIERKKRELEKMLNKVAKEKQPVSIRQVAETAEVSVATVSRVFNNFPSLKPSTREKVFRVARELGYAPVHKHELCVKGPKTFSDY